MVCNKNNRRTINKKALLLDAFVLILVLIFIALIVVYIYNPFENIGVGVKNGSDIAKNIFYP